MIKHTLFEQDRILLLEPKERLSASDFVTISEAVDDFIHTNQSLKGVLIYSRDFPGWESFSAVIDHFKFVKDHHKEIGKVGIVSDSKVAEIASVLASHFIAAEVQAFPYADYEKAYAWMLSS